MAVVSRLLRHRASSPGRSPGPRIVCECLVVDRRAVEAAIDAGATTVEEVTAACAAGGGCGRCRPDIEALLGSAGPSPRRRP